MAGQEDGKERFKKIKKLLILGAAYKADVGDDRLSPTYKLIESLKKHVKNISIHDPYIKKFHKKFNIDKFQCLIFCVNHQVYKKINFKNINKSDYVIDLNNVLSKKQINFVKKKTNNIFVLGNSLK